MPYSALNASHRKTNATPQAMMRVMSCGAQCFECSDICSHTHAFTSKSLFFCSEGLCSCFGNKCFKPSKSILSGRHTTSPTTIPSRSQAPRIVARSYSRRRASQYTNNVPIQSMAMSHIFPEVFRRQPYRSERSAPRFRSWLVGVS